MHTPSPFYQNSSLKNIFSELGVFMARGRGLAERVKVSCLYCVMPISMLLSDLDEKKYAIIV
jgi:hypothetical protein